MDIKQKILIVEDDKRLSELIGKYLGKQGFEIIIEPNGSEACHRISAESPDLIILDLMLPGKDGLSICREARGEYKGPILILTAREDDMDQVAALEMGADDYVIKPVEPRVLLARIRALFRRMVEDLENSKNDNSNPVLKFGCLEINMLTRNVFKMKKQVNLSTSEFDLLLILVKNNGEIIDRDTISMGLRGFGYDGLDRSIDILMSRLRKKIGIAPDNSFEIKTVWGSGYTFLGEPAK